MSTDLASQAIDRARAKVAAAFAILLDPATSPSSAEIHLLRAWRLLRRSEVGGRATEDDEALIAWIETNALPLSDDARRGAASLVRELVKNPNELSREPTPRHSRRELLRNARDLGRALDRLEPRVRGAKTMKRAWLGRGAKAAAAVALFVAFVVTIRSEPDVGTGPWRAAFYPTRNFEEEPIVQRHPDIAFSWGTGSPHERVPEESFSARWHTCLVLDEKTTLIFVLQSDDGSRLFVDGDLVANAWSGGALRQAQGEVELQPGVHHLQLDYFELTGVASVSLRASLNGRKPAPIPASMLRYPGDDQDPQAPCRSVER